MWKDICLSAPKDIPNRCTGLTLQFSRVFVTGKIFNYFVGGDNWLKFKMEGDFLTPTPLKGTKRPRLSLYLYWNSIFVIIEV